MGKFTTSSNEVTLDFDSCWEYGGFLPTIGGPNVDPRVLVIRTPTQSTLQFIETATYQKWALTQAVKFSSFPLGQGFLKLAEVHLGPRVPALCEAPAPTFVKTRLLKRPLYSNWFYQLRSLTLRLKGLKF